MAEEHLSIGEVLAELADDYPDVTISKIRFLESQGLIDPERTPSGYRKFYPGDVERLRWILHQQKENFLPLKVIRDRMDELDGESAPSAPDPVPEAEEAPKARGGRRPGAAKQNPGAAKQKAAAKKAASKKSGAKKSGSRQAGVKSPSGSRGAASSRHRGIAAHDAPMLPLEEVGSEPVARSAPITGATFTRDELARAAGIDDEALAQLESFAIVVPIARGERVLFDEEALLVARTAAGFAKHGIEARHLKMYVNFAGREAGMFEQVLLPHVRQRNPESKAKAQGELEELAKLGAMMRITMLRRSITRTLSG